MGRAVALLLAKKKKKVSSFCALSFFAFYRVCQQSCVCFFILVSSLVTSSIMSFAGITASHLVAAIQYRSIKFTTLPVAKAEEIARALMLRVPLEEIETVQQDPGKGNWTVIFKSITAAERLAEKGFTLLNEHISPVLYNKRLITATVAFAPPGTTPTDIQAVLQEYAQVKQIHPIFLRDFPSIKSGKFRVVLQLNGEGTPEEVLPSFITLHGRRASLFFSGRISRCPYCNSADHLGRDCPHKGQPRCFSCNVLGHVRANCPDLAAQSTATNVALAVVEDPESAQISPPPLSTAETPTAEPAAAASQDLFENNSPLWIALILLQMIPHLTPLRWKIRKKKSQQKDHALVLPLTALNNGRRMVNNRRRKRTRNTNE